MIQGKYDASPASFGIASSLLRAIKIKSSRTELLHLSIATLLITRVGLSFNHYRYVSWQFLLVFISMNWLINFWHNITEVGLSSVHNYMDL
jgi:hypothetical protein